MIFAYSNFNEWRMNQGGINITMNRQILLLPAQ